MVKTIKLIVRILFVLFLFTLTIGCEDTPMSTEEIALDLKGNIARDYQSLVESRIFPEDTYLLEELEGKLESCNNEDCYDFQIGYSSLILFWTMVRQSDAKWVIENQRPALDDLNNILSSCENNCHCSYDQYEDVMSYYSFEINKRVRLLSFIDIEQQSILYWKKFDHENCNWWERKISPELVENIIKGSEKRIKEIIQELQELEERFSIDTP